MSEKLLVPDIGDFENVEVIELLVKQGQEIRENDHNLNIRRYADTSPPPENFDVKGILHGGIPIKEIQDDYIKEILNGFDMSSILVPKDDEYMIFKDEIKEKSQIRKFLVSESD